MALLLSELIATTIEQVRSSNLSQKTQTITEKALDEFSAWCLARGESLYSYELGDLYCCEMTGLPLYGRGKIAERFRSKRAAIRRLDSMAYRGTIDYQAPLCRQDFYGRFRGLFERYENWMIEEERSSVTILAIHGYLYVFCKYAEKEDIDVTAITLAQLEAFFSSLEKPLASQHAYRKAVKGFLSYLYREGVSDADLSVNVSEDKYHEYMKGKLPAILSVADINAAIGKIDRSTDVGKRDYAIMHVVAQLGLRPGDVAALTIDDIDWQQDILTYRQEKTGGLVQQPITPSLGNALIDYLMNGRPKTCARQVFVSHTSASNGRKLKSGTIGDIVRLRLRGTTPICGGKTPGARTLRSSLASNLLAENASIAEVKSTLGHTSINTAKHYIAIDFNGLKRCALPIPPVKSPLYQAARRSR